MSNSEPNLFHREPGVEIWEGDCLSVMPTFEANRFSTCITDPPYGLKFMGKSWDHGVPGSQFWREVMRVCKPGAMLLAFGGTRTYHRLAVAIEDAGWEVRDCIMWTYGSGFPKSLDISKAIDKAAGAEREIVSSGTPVKRMIPGSDQHETGSWIKDNGREFLPTITRSHTDNGRLWSGWGTALKPAWEPVIVAMKPIDGTFADNAVRYGVAGFNIDGGRVELNGDYKSKSNGRPSQTGLPDNYISELANQPDSIGRFPANLIHDGSDEVLQAFPDTPGQLADLSYTAPSTPFKNAYGKMNRQGEPSADNRYTDQGSTNFAAKPGQRRADSGSAARFFYCAKASRSDRGEGNKHPTVKPQALMRYLCTLTATPTGGEILDPFGGSMSTIVAAQAVGRPVVGIDLDAENCRTGVSRLKPKFKPDDRVVLGRRRGTVTTTAAKNGVVVGVMVRWDDGVVEHKQAELLRKL